MLDIETLGDDPEMSDWLRERTVPSLERPIAKLDRENAQRAHERCDAILAAGMEELCSMGGSNSSEGLSKETRLIRLLDLQSIILSQNASKMCSKSPLRKNDTPIAYLCRISITQDVPDWSMQNGRSDRTQTIGP